MPAATHYVRHRGQITGPFDTGALLLLVRRGAVSRVHQLSTDRATWTAAEKYSELFGGPLRLPRSSGNDEPEWLNPPAYADGGPLGELAAAVAEPSHAWVGPSEPECRFPAAMVALTILALGLLAGGIALTVYVFTRDNPTRTPAPPPSVSRPASSPG